MLSQGRKEGNKGRRGGGGRKRERRGREERMKGRRKDHKTKANKLLWSEENVPCIQWQNCYQKGSTTLIDVTYHIHLFPSICASLREEVFSRHSKVGHFSRKLTIKAVSPISPNSSILVSFQKIRQTNFQLPFLLTCPARLFLYSDGVQGSGWERDWHIRSSSVSKVASYPSPAFC